MTSSFTLCQNHISENVVLSNGFNCTDINKVSNYILYLTCVCNSTILPEINRFHTLWYKNRYKIGHDISMCKNDQIVKLLLHSFYYEILLFRYGRIYSLFGHDVIADWWNRYLVYTLAGYYNGLRFVHSAYTYFWSLFQITVT